MAISTESSIDLNPHHLREILRILNLYLPNVEVRAFGSRVTWTAKDYSDIDLALMTEQPISLEVDALLREAFDESTIPIKVDFVDWASTSPSFRKLIAERSVVIRPALRTAQEESWSVFSLEDALEALLDYRGKTPEKSNSGVPLITAKIVKNGRIEPATEFIARESYTAWMTRGLPKKGDVVLTTEAPLGEVAQLDTDQVALAQRIVVLRGKTGLLDNTYLRYLLQTEDMQEQLAARATGTTVLGIKQSELRKIPLRLPSLTRQCGIASVLLALDDRITLLRETNATLEAIAQALFKSWFVDFDPVRAKMEGRTPEGMDEATAALFPDGFEASELGVVPRGWQAGPLSAQVEGVYDGPHATPPDATEGGVFLGIKNLTGTALDLSDVRYIAESDWERWTKRITPRARDIVFSYEATLGFFALIPPDLRCCLGRRLALVRPKERDGFPHFWFHQFVAAPFQALLEKHTIHGATVNRIALKSFPDLPVLVPPIELRRAFDSTVAELWERIHCNGVQVATLSTLRDTLLPRLISGQLRLPEAKATTAEALAN